jgi:nucleoside-diphosphate-sugar epimerase
VVVKRILVTGAAGFIGSHVAEALLERGDAVVGLDEVNDYYPVASKRENLALLGRHPRPGRGLCEYCHLRGCVGHDRRGVA